jgi:hypothetical protein
MTSASTNGRVEEVDGAPLSADIRSAQPRRWSFLHYWGG